MAEEEDEEITEEEQLALQKALLKYGNPEGEVKHNVHTFLKEVLDTKDTTKVGYLSADELGMPSHPVRVYKELALYADKVLDNSFLKDLFMQDAENIFATSLSREGKLINLAVITVKKQSVTSEEKIRKVNKGWFGKKEPKESNEF